MGGYVTQICALGRSNTCSWPHITANITANLEQVYMPMHSMSMYSSSIQICTKHILRILHCNLANK